MTKSARYLEKEVENLGHDKFLNMGKGLEEKARFKVDSEISWLGECCCL